MTASPELRPAGGAFQTSAIVGGATPWTDPAAAPTRPEEFTFSLLSDRTGFARRGVFERAIEVTNLFRPDFAIHVGDAIEGYTEDADEIRAQWDEFDGITGELEVPLFRTPGNHDVSNPTMRDEWLRRFGALHYAFTYRDALFVVLDTQDPPQSFEEMGLTAETFEELHSGMFAKLQEDPAEFFAAHDDHLDGPMPAKFGEAQLTWLEQVLAEAPAARWTFVIMHMPVWQDQDDAGYRRIRAALGDRPFTMFAGHCHNYRREVIDGRDHIRLGSSGGVWVTDRPEGNLDHITLVQMTPEGPRIANVMLDGVIGVEGGAYEPKRPLEEPMEFELTRVPTA
jgi:hypothetical protein